MESASDSYLSDPVESALADLHASLDRLAALSLVPSTGQAATELVKSVERAQARVDSLSCEAMCAVEESRTYGLDGHVSAKAMVRHHADLSNRTALARKRIGGLGSVLPVTSQLFRDGDVGFDKMAVLGQVGKNPRIKDEFAAMDEWFAEIALDLKFDEFKQVVKQWERIADADGTREKAERAHQRRDFNISEVGLDPEWVAKGQFGSLQGAALAEVFELYVKAEFERDWEAAKAIHGDDVSLGHLERTPAQRRADALARIFHDATAADETAVGANYLHNIVWSQETFEETLDAIEQDRAPEYDIDTYKCETGDGVQLDPVEAAFESLFSQIRRVVVDAKGVVIDLGRARLFTGKARQAAILQSTCCIWPGCHRPSSQCEVDHLHDYASGGRTNPGNGAPLCGRHNRHKQKGFTIRRNNDGELEIRRPDGTVLE